MNWKNFDRPFKSYSEMKLYFRICWAIMHFIMSITVILAGNLDDLLPMNAVTAITCFIIYLILPRYMWKQIERENIGE